jgi:predicted RNA-binding protein YlxR (DUF448 family)
MSDRYVPMRRCLGCMKSRPKAEMLRIAISEGDLVVDSRAVLPGRGVYLCRDRACIEAAFKKNAFSRSFRRGFPKERLEALKEEILNI